MSALSRFPGLSDLLRDAESSGRPAVLLDAQLSEHPDSGASILALDAREILSWPRVSGSGATESDSDPWEELKRFRGASKGWIFGYLGYELNHTEFGLPMPGGATMRDGAGGTEVSGLAGALQSIPGMWFMRPATVLRFHHRTAVIEVLLDEAGRAAHWIEVIRGEATHTEGSTAEDDGDTAGGVHLSSPLFPDKARYIETVERLKHDIREGEYYEVNFTYPIRMGFKGDLIDFADAMFSRGNIPFGAVLLTGADVAEHARGSHVEGGTATAFALGRRSSKGLSVVSVSPERFLKRKGSTVLSQPIKGTVRRGRDEQEDRRLRQHLLNEKNKAENLMIVDLVRNDLNTVCIPGSVRVPRLFEIQTFGTVHQLVSSVEGELPPGSDCVDVIRACYPMGSMTGAPKRAAMHSIQRNEQSMRGIYSGAIGYITPEGDFDFNVAIRTCIFPPFSPDSEGEPEMTGIPVTHRPLLYHVGGAITGDSEPHMEWEETLVKARGLLDLI